MKKMTAKEFKEALDKAGMPFECWEWEGILNDLCRMGQRDELEAFKRGHNTIANDYHERWTTMYSILEERGYYNS